VSERAAMWTSRRLTVWGAGLLLLSWFIYVHTMMVPGYVDRAGRFKGTDYIYFYVMGSLMLEGRADALYDADAHLAEGRRRIDPGLALYAPYSNYGPQVAGAFAPLARLRFGPSLALFLILSLVTYAASVWIVWRQCPALWPYPGVTAILGGASPALFSMIRYAQLSAFTLLLLSAALAAFRHNRRFLAGLVIGTMVFKPQLGLVIGVVMVVAGEWRVVGGAIAAAAVQLALAWAISGSAVMAEYFRVLGRLALNPALVQIYPTEVHSLRGFFQLFVPSPVLLSAVTLIALVAVLAIAVKTWKSGGTVAVKWGQLVILSILASPHLLTYDLVLLAIPMITFAAWAVAHRDHRLQPWVSRLLLLLYLAPFSSNLVRLVPIQLSVVVMVLLVATIHVATRDEPAGAAVVQN
jgi:alpha-1,2-mannosyltransferase